MAKLSEYKKVRVSNILTWERAKKGKIYPEGSFCIQVSATKGQMQYLDEPRAVESHFCVFQLRNSEYYPKYVFLIFREGIPDFLKKVQTGLNIVPEVFEEYEIVLHQDNQTQIYITCFMDIIEKRIEEEERMINELVNMKKYHLGTMFPRINK